jgi:hypothetical protein
MEEHLIKLASERNLNKNIFPIMNIKGKHIKEYPFKVSFQDHKMICETGIINPKNLMIMDILGTYMIHLMFNKNSVVDYAQRIPMANEGKVKYLSNLNVSKKILGNFETRLNPMNGGKVPQFLYNEESELPKEIFAPFNRMKKPLTISLTDRYLKIQLPFLKKYSSNRMKKLFLQTAEAKVQMIYPIRFYNGNAYENYSYCNANIFSKLFSINNVEDIKISKNGKILERRYEITFDTILGFLFTQNCLSCYTDLLPGKFYLLSDYAQLLYRILILPYFNKVKIPLKLSEIKGRLILKSENYMTRKVVKRLLDELESHLFIKEPKELKIYDEYCYSFVKPTWNEMNCQ